MEVSFYTTQALLPWRKTQFIHEYDVFVECRKNNFPYPAK
jgi:hypothetical protein